MLFFAWRNIFRNKKRTLITVLSVFFGMLLIAMMRFLTYGTHMENIERTLRLGTGFGQIAAYGWPESHLLERALDVTPEFLQSLQSEVAIEHISPRIEAAALAAFGENSRFVTVFGADWKLEQGITILHERIISGQLPREIQRFAERDRKNIPLYEAAIGEGLAKYLGAGLGSELALTGPQFDGSTGAILAVVTGIYKTKTPALDNQQVLLSLKAADELFAPSVGLEPPARRYTSLALAFNGVPEKQLPLLRQKFQEPEAAPGIKPEDSEIYDPVAYDWKELNPAIVKYFELDAIGNEFALVFIIVIMAFGVLNTVELSIHERTREFGILMAIGTRNHQLQWQVFLETLMLVSFGILAGVAASLALGFYYEANPIVFTGAMAEAMENAGTLPTMRASVDPRQLTIGILSLAVPSILLSLLAIHRISKVSPVEVIHEL